MDHHGFYPRKKRRGGSEKKTDKVPFAGVIGFDGKTLHLADKGQMTHITAKLLSPDKMQLVFVMPGEPALAFRATFKREKP